MAKPETESQPAPKPTYEVKLLEFDALKNAPEKGLLVFAGAFSECVTFAKVLDDVRPEDKIGMIDVEIRSAAYKLSIARSDGLGASFVITSKGGKKRAEMRLPL